MAFTKGMVFCAAFNLSRKVEVKEFHLILEYAYTYNANWMYILHVL